VRPFRAYCPRLLLALVPLLFAPTALAQGWLAGGSFGSAQQFSYDVGGPITTYDDTDSGMRVFGGYMFTPVHGVVTSWVDLGSPYYAGPAFGGFTDDLSADGLDVSYLIGFAPGTQNRVTLFSTIGFFQWKQKVHYVDASGTYDYEDDGTSLSFGVGSEVNFSAGGGSAWGFHFEWQQFLDVGDKNNSGHEYDRKLFSAGVDYRFGR